MEHVLFPKWESFLGFYIFLRIYNPTRQYLDRTSALAFSIFFAIVAKATGVDRTTGGVFSVLASAVAFSFFYSVPYLVGGVLGAIVQQLLLLNEQSVQDKRFTDESEAMSIMGSLVFTAIALESEAEPLKPLIYVMTSGFTQVFTIADIFARVTSALYIAAILSAKYIIVMLVLSFMGAYVDMFFKKAGFSSVTISLKAMTVVALLDFWFIHDHGYLFKMLMGKQP